MLKAVQSKIEKGFTLIELLIVISVIGLLSTFVIFNFQSTGPKVRDAQRKSDLKQYQESLTLYASKNTGFYPQYSSATTVSVLCTKLSLTACPDDPKPVKGGAVYGYSSDGNNLGGPGATKFVLSATLEYETGNPYWVVCSNGKTGISTNQAVNGNCPI